MFPKGSRSLLGPLFLAVLQKLVQPIGGFVALPLKRVGIYIHRRRAFGMAQNLADVNDIDIQIVQQGGTGMPLRYNNDKRKKPLFSRGLSVCRHLFNSFSKLKHGEKNIEKRRLFH